MRGATGARAWPDWGLGLRYGTERRDRGGCGVMRGVRAAVLVVGPCERQRIQEDIPPGRMCLKREDHT